MIPLTTILKTDTATNDSFECYVNMRQAITVFEKSIKIVSITPHVVSSFEIFVKVGIGDIAVRNPHGSWLGKFSMYS